MKKEKNIINGWLNVDKPKGFTSADVVNIIKKILRPHKIGHTGTLDPMATGVLPIALGEATKLIQFIENKTKTYEFRIVFGAETDTDDAEGKIIKTSEKIPTLKEIQTILPKFIGKIKQTPPIYSALKINGVRAYELARAGEKPEMKEREIEVFSLCISPPACGEGLSELYFTTAVSRGTYIRTLAKDIASELGTLGHIDYLRRVKDGVFQLSDPRVQSSELNESKAISLNSKLWTLNSSNLDLQSLKNDIINQISEIDIVLDDIPVLYLDSVSCNKLKFGQKIAFNSGFEGKFKVYNEGSKILHSIAESSEGLLQTVRGFNL